MLVPRQIATSATCKNLLILASLSAVLSAVSACGDADGVPQATIKNSLGENKCLIEARYLGYGFATPINPNGVMTSREVVEGSDYAYAISMDLNGEDRNTLATRCGGHLWITKQKYEAKAGEVTVIEFNSETATQINPSDTAAYSQGKQLFTRLSDACSGTSN